MRGCSKNAEFPAHDECPPSHVLVSSNVWLCAYKCEVSRLVGFNLDWCLARWVWPRGRGLQEKGRVSDGLWMLHQVGGERLQKHSDEVEATLEGKISGRSALPEREA